MRAATPRRAIHFSGVHGAHKGIVGECFSTLSCRSLSGCDRPVQRSATFIPVLPVPAGYLSVPLPFRDVLHTRKPSSCRDTRRAGLVFKARERPHEQRIRHLRRHRGIRVSKDFLEKLVRITFFPQFLLFLKKVYATLHGQNSGFSSACPADGLWETRSDCGGG